MRVQSHLVILFFLSCKLQRFLQLSTLSERVSENSGLDLPSFGLFGAYVPLMHERICCFLTSLGGWLCFLASTRVQIQLQICPIYGVEFGYVSEDMRAGLIGVSKLRRVHPAVAL